MVPIRYSILLYLFPLINNTEAVIMIIMEIKIKHCNNIEEGNIEIIENTLNIPECYN